MYIPNPCAYVCVRVRVRVRVQKRIVDKHGNLDIEMHVVDALTY